VSVKVYPFDPSFRFDVAQFRALVCDPVTVPPHVDVRLTVDPAYFANDDFDESALCATFLDNVDDVRVLTILDASSGRWPGLALPDRIVAMAEKWNVAEIRVESNGNGAPELLKAVCELRAEMKGITLPPKTLFRPNNKPPAKRCRIFKLQSLVECTPPALRICAGTHVNKFLGQLQNYRFDNESNSRREDGLADVVAIAAFGS
jgi:hypothetical protein